MYAVDDAMPMAEAGWMADEASLIGYSVHQRMNSEKERKSYRSCDFKYTECVVLLCGVLICVPDVVVPAVKNPGNALTD